MSEAPGRGGRRAWVVHAGALGDFVMMWPLARALVESGREVTVVAAASKAALASAELGVTGVSMEQPRFTRVWEGATGVRPSDREEGVREVYSFVATDESAAGEAGQRWREGAARLFPGARVVLVGSPGSASRASVWRAVRADGVGAEPDERLNPDGPIVMHVGAGSAAKRWGLDRWRGLFEHVVRVGGAAGAPVVLAGEVEEEQFGAVDRRLFASMGGRFVRALGELAGQIKRARVFVGADSGPTHLAGQLGVGTVALFGPTDPGVWKPIGPRVRVVAPEAASGMEWLGVERVARELGVEERARDRA
ncbi:MAG: glycosyltransferase family 9 protein [Phycisphaerales bacterium]